MEEVATIALSIDEDNWLLLEKVDFEYEVSHHKGLSGVKFGPWQSDETKVHIPPGTFTLNLLEGPRKGKPLEMCWDGTYVICLTDGWRLPISASTSAELLSDMSGGMEN